MMKHNIKKFGISLAAGILCLSILGGCTSETSPDTANNTSTANSANNEQEYTDEMLEAKKNETFRPSDSVFPSAESYEYPFMGLKAVLPESLMEQMDNKEVAMLPDEAATNDQSAIKYAFLSWNVMTEEQRDAEVSALGNGYWDWIDSLQRIGTLGVYQADLEKQLDEITRCNEHTLLGESADGAYKYYLSTNTDADAALTDEIKQIQTEITEMTPFQQMSAFEMPRTQTAGTSVGEFTTQDVNGTTYTQDMFKDYDLTMINIFTTWCTPCVGEMPDLEKLHQQVADKNVNVVGVVLDVLDEKGEIVPENLENAQKLVEKTGVTYPILLPDSTYMNGRLTGIQAVPETFFVDKDGNIAGETYSGSGSLEDWLEVVEQELANLKGAD